MAETMYLRIHTTPETNEFDVSVGDTFAIINEDEFNVYIEIDGYPLSFSKEPDMLGRSYATWFDVVTEVS